MAWFIPVALAASGALQGQRAQEQQKRDRELQAATALYSPWTGLRPSPVQERGGPTEGAAQGFLGGLGFNQSLAQAGAQNRLNEALINHYNRMNRSPASEPGMPEGSMTSALSEPEGLGSFYRKNPSPWSFR